MADLTRIKGLAGRLSATRRGLARLAIVKTFGGLLLILSAALMAALLGVFDLMSPAAGAGTALIILVSGLILVWRGWKRFTYPSREVARAVFDQQSPLRPLSTLTDRPAAPNADGQRLWQAHSERLMRVAEALRPPKLTKAWHAADPYALRYGVPVVLAAAILFAGGEGPGRLARALSPDFGSLAGADELQIDAWLTPPDYTGRAPIFLRTDRPKVETASGSEITLRAHARSAPTLILRGPDGRRKVRFTQTPDGAYEAKTHITQTVEATVNWWGPRAAWSIATLPDAAPAIAFVATPVLTGKDKTGFTWSAGDDYGIENVDLVLALATPHPDAPTETARIPLDLPGPSLKEITDEVTALDLSRHRWAGLEVQAYLEARDGGGQKTQSEKATFKLPERLFLRALARAAQEIRVTVLREPCGYYGEPTRGSHDSACYGQEVLTQPFLPAYNRLEYAPEGILDATYMLDAVTYKPQIFFKDYSLFLGLRSARSILASAITKDNADTVDSLLWAIALKAEYGSAADALAALLAAKKALETALREGASEEEIARLTDAFRQAAENYIQAKLAEAVANGTEGAPPPGQDGAGGAGGSGFGNNTFQDMLNALEDLTETGATDQARQLLADITNLLENLEFQQGGQGQGDGFALPGAPSEESEEDERSEAEQELSGALDELSDTLRDQRELNDDTLEADRRGGQETEGSALDGDTLADRQQTIGEALEEFTDRQAEATENGDEAGAGELTDEDQERLGQARRAQEFAEEALENGQFGQASRYQQRSTRILSELAGTIAERLDDLERARTGLGEEDAPGTDPFGRTEDGQFGFGSGDVDVPSEAERQRAKDILEELRKRYGDADEGDERDYLERLLDRF